MNHDGSKSKPRGHYPGYTSRFAKISAEDDRDDRKTAGDYAEYGEPDGYEESADYAEYDGYDESGENGDYNEYNDYSETEDYEMAPYRELSRKAPVTRGGRGGKALNVSALWERLRGVFRGFTSMPGREAPERGAAAPVKKAGKSGAKAIIPLPERLAPRPASFLQTGDYAYPADDSPSLKGLKILAAFVVLAVALYLVTNNLSDSLADNDYSGAAIVDGGGGSTGGPVAGEPARNYNMSTPYMAELVEIAANYPIVYDICDSIWRYPTELLELVIKNNETAEFVAEYLTYGRGAAVIAAQVDVSGDVTAGLIPHFIQWDRRWGYSLYGSQMMGLDGCGPTSLSMVAVGLTGNTAYNPRYVSDFAQDNGYITSDNSTTWTLMSEGSKSLGITPRELTLDANAITSALRRGEPIIASMGPGDFTRVGHFIVMTGVTDTGMILINDANSRINTATEWELSRLMTQIKNLWAFTVTAPEQ